MTLRMMVSISLSDRLPKASLISSNTASVYIIFINHMYINVIIHTLTDTVISKIQSLKRLNNRYIQMNIYELIHIYKYIHTYIRKYKRINIHSNTIMSHLIVHSYVQTNQNLTNYR
jgi:hypothetical protein